MRQVQPVDQTREPWLMAQIVELGTADRHDAHHALVVTGCATSVCVESTIRDAYFRGYQSVLLTDASTNPSDSRCPEPITTRD